MKYLLNSLTLLLIIFWINSSSQPIRFSLSNNLRFGSGNQMVNEGRDEKKGKEYLENLTDFKLYKDNFNVGVRLLYDNPPEYGVPFKGIHKRFIQYSSENVEIVAGNQNILFSRGLSLNLYENRGITFDNELDGVKLLYRNQLFKTTLIAGNIEFLDPNSLLYLNTPFIENYNIKGANLEMNPVKFLHIGGSYLKTNVKGPYSQIFIDSIVERTSIENFEANIELNLKYLDFYAAYSVKSNSISDLESNQGTGFYASLSHSGRGYGLTFEYKDYRFDMVDPLNRSDQTRPTRMAGFQNPPTVIKEHSYTFLTRYPHVVDFNDEVGLQLDAFFNIFDSFNFNFNFSWASRHFIYNLNPSDFTLTRYEKGKTYLPSFDEERSPYYEIFSEVEYNFADYTSFIKIAFDLRESINYDPYNPTKKSQLKKYITIPVLLQYSLDDTWSVKFSSEQQLVKEFPMEENYYNQFIGIQLSHSPDWTIGLRMEFTSNKFEPMEKKAWILGEGSYKINNNHTVILSYGEERGGQICSNGICRQMYPFSGFRLSVLSYIN